MGSSTEEKVNSDSKLNNVLTGISGWNFIPWTDLAEIYHRSRSFM